MTKNLLIAMLGIATFACGPEEGSQAEKLCIPNEPSSCTCENGMGGSHICQPDGMAFSMCVCEEPETSTGQQTADASAGTTTSSNESEGESTSPSETHDGTTTSGDESSTTSTSGMTTEAGTSLDSTSTSTTNTSVDTTESSTDTEGGEDTVQPVSLVVKADGEKIGYLDFVSYYTIYVWDDVKDIYFGINDSTGYLTGGWATTFENATCSGYGISMTIANIDICEDAPVINHPHVGGFGGDGYGFTKPTKALIASGKPIKREVQSVKLQQDECGDYTNIEYYQCAVELKETNLIPTAFPLPITISED